MKISRCITLLITISITVSSFAQFPRLNLNLGGSYDLPNFYRFTLDQGMRIEENYALRFFLEFDLELDLRSVIGVGGSWQQIRLQPDADLRYNPPSYEEFGIHEYGPHIFYTFRLIFNEDAIESVAKGRHTYDAYNWFSLTAGMRYNIWDNSRFEEYRFQHDETNFLGNEVINFNDSGLTAFFRISYEFNLFGADDVKSKLFLQQDLNLNNRFEPVTGDKDRFSYDTFSIGLTLIGIAF